MKIEITNVALIYVVLYLCGIYLNKTTVFIIVSQGEYSNVI